MNENIAMNPQTAVTTRLCSSDIIPLISFLSFEFDSSGIIEMFELKFILPTLHCSLEARDPLFFITQFAIIRFE